MEGAYYTHWLKFTNVAHITIRRLVVPGGQSACLESVMSWVNPSVYIRAGRGDGERERRKREETGWRSSGREGSKVYVSVKWVSGHSADTTIMVIKRAVCCSQHRLLTQLITSALCIKHLYPFSFFLSQGLYILRFLLKILVPSLC